MVYAQDPPKPKPAESASRQSPVPASEPAAPPPGASPNVDAGKVDPSQMAAPPSHGHIAPTTAAPVDAKKFILGAEDVIFITVWRSPEFSGQHTIRPDGKITIPLVGEVQAAGLTPEVFGASIQDRLKKVLKEPDVSVAVIQVNSKRYFIEGEVLKPGEYKLVVPTRVLEALVNAGGFKDFAKQTNITIMRGTQRLKFNYKAVIAGKNTEQNVYLEPGDIIIVK
jgi:polysaccharide export outer membrane protein